MIVNLAGLPYLSPWQEDWTEDQGGGSLATNIITV